MRVPLFKERRTLRPPRQTIRRVLVILSPTDAGVPTVRALGRRLRPLGIALVAASECHGEVQGERGECLIPNLLLVDAAARQWDAIVVAGGAGALVVAEDAFARDLVRRAAAGGLPLVALGPGRAVLERAGAAGFASDDAAAAARWLVERLGVTPPAADHRRRAHRSLPASYICV